jgi:hypothetical protein
MAQAAAHLAGDVHLDQRKRLRAVLEEPEQKRRGQRHRTAVFQRTHRRAARKQVEQGHLAGSVACGTFLTGVIGSQPTTVDRKDRIQRHERVRLNDLSSTTKSDPSPSTVQLAHLHAAPLDLRR